MVEKSFSRPTLRDVARHARVSVASASRVLNGSTAVGADMSARVQAAISALDYRPNGVASSLRRRDQSTATVGLVLADVANPFYSAVAAAAERVAERNASLLITASSNENAEREQRLISTLTARRVDGLLVCPAGDQHAFLKSEVHRGTPVVFLDRPPSGVDADVVLMENRAGSRRLVEYLLRRGHRRIGVVAFRDDEYTSSERVAGYYQALDDAGVKRKPGLVMRDCFNSLRATQATHDLLDLREPPSAIFAYNNRTALGVLRVVKDRHASVEVVCFDDLEYGSLLDPPVTVSAHQSRRDGPSRGGVALRADRRRPPAGTDRHVGVSPDHPAIGRTHFRTTAPVRGPSLTHPHARRSPDTGLD